MPHFCTTSLVPMLNLFPPQALVYDKRGKWLDFKSDYALTHDDIQRTSFWAASVECLKLPPLLTCVGGIGPRAMRQVFLEKKMFANVRALEINDLYALLISQHIVGHKLQSLTIKLSQLPNPAHCKAAMVGFSYPLKALLNASSQLVSLNIFIHQQNVILYPSWPDYERLVCETRKTLRSFISPFPLTTIAAASLFINTLGSCRIKLDHADQAALDNVLGAVPEAAVPWSQMRYLQLEFHQLTDQTISLLEKLKLPRLETLELKICSRQGATRVRLLRLTETLASLPCQGSLKSLMVCVAPRGADMTSTAGHDDLYFLDIAVIKPLLCFHSLFLFSFNSDDLIVNNQMVAVVASAFPLLKQLRLLGYQSRDVPPKATWKALKLLNSRCPHLIELDLTINSRKHRHYYERGAVSPSLRFWLVRTSPLPPPKALKTLNSLARALYIKNPNLLRVIFVSSRNPLVWPNYGQSWNEVMRYIGLIRLPGSLSATN